MRSFFHEPAELAHLSGWIWHTANFKLAEPLTRRLPPVWSTFHGQIQCSRPDDKSENAS